MVWVFSKPPILRESTLRPIPTFIMPRVGRKIPQKFAIWNDVAEIDVNISKPELSRCVKNITNSIAVPN
jgi:hypothetical protein